MGRKVLCILAQNDFHVFSKIICIELQIWQSKKNSKAWRTFLNNYELCPFNLIIMNYVSFVKKNYQNRKSMFLTTFGTIKTYNLVFKAQTKFFVDASSFDALIFE